MQGIAAAGNDLAVEDDEAAVKDAKDKAALARRYREANTVLDKLRDQEYVFQIGTLSPELLNNPQPITE